MRPRRPRARRAMRHPVRVVALPPSEQPAMASEMASAYRIGLYAASLLYEHFPAFYAETHTDAMPISLPGLLGCTVAFWQLVEAKGLLLRWPGEAGYHQGGLTRYELADTPEETIVMFDGVSEEYMSDLGHYLHVPRPCLYGYGVQALLDQESDAYPNQPLTMLLWHLFERTGLGLGVPLLPMAANIDEDLAIDLLRIKQLPADTPLSLLGAHLVLPIAKEYGVKPLDLIRYAFGKTANDMANYDDYEAEAIYMGELDEEWSWTQLDRMVELQREAKQLADAYTEWSERTTTLADLRRLAGQIHKATRAAARELAEPPKTLLALLGHEQLLFEHEAVAV